MLSLGRVMESRWLCGWSLNNSYLRWGGAEACSARSSRDGDVYATATQLVLRIAAGRGSDSGAGVTSKATRSPLRNIKRAILAPAARNAAAAARNKQDKCDKYAWGEWVMLAWPSLWGYGLWAIWSSCLLLFSRASLLWPAVSCK